MANWHDRQNAIALAILRHHANALPHRIAWRSDFDFLAFEENLPLMGARPDTKQARYEFRTPRTNKARDAQYLAAP
ncbi:hypothetical protein D3C80_1775470 [compost metagenome]